MFDTTRPSLLHRALLGDDSGRKALGELFTIYRPALRRYVLVYFRALADNVDEIVDDFLFRKFVGGKLIALYIPGPDRRFRTLLRTAVRNHCLGLLRTKRRQAAALHGPMYALDESTDSSDYAEPDSFDLAWARQVFGRAVRAVKRECDSDPSRLAAVWGVLRARFLRPLRGKVHIHYPELVRRFRFSSPAVAQKAATRGKRMLADAMLAAAGEYSGSEDARSELNALWMILERAGGLRRERGNPERHDDHCEE